MFYRVNEALNPRIRGGRAESLAYIICEAACRVVHRLNADEEWRQLVALHVLDAGTSSTLLDWVSRIAREIEEKWAEAGLPAHAPLGSGRRFARDCGGRITTTLGEWVASSGLPRLGYPTGTEPRCPVDEARRNLWDLAHPEVAVAVKTIVAGFNTSHGGWNGWLNLPRLKEALEKALENIENFSVEEEETAS